MHVLLPVHNLDYLHVVTKIGTVPKLTHDNFPTWSNVIMFILIGTDTGGIVEGMEVETPVDSNKPTKPR